MFALLFAAPPADSEEVQSAADALRERFESQTELAEKALSELGTKYLEALRNMETGYREKADLESLLKFSAEIKRFENSRTPPQVLSENQQLARIQKIYQESHRAESANRQRRLRTIRSEYVGGLKTLIDDLTRKGKLEEANALQKIVRRVTLTQSLTHDLVLHLQFEGRTGKAIPDLSPVGNDGTLHGDAVVRTTPGIRESYVELDGRGDFIQIPHDPTLSLTTDCTIALWVRAREFRDLHGLVCKYIPKNAFTFRISARKIRGLVMFGDYNNTNVSKSALVLDRWTHLAVTLSDNKVSFYFDGLLDASAERPKPRPLATNTNPVRVGSDYDGRYFKGDVDEVRIYRRALSAEEVAELFRSES